MTERPGASSASLAALYDVQTERRRRWIATVGAIFVGMGVASVHWSGLLVGGALVGFAWPTLGRALVAGFAFGVVALVVFASQLALAGSLAAYLGMGPILAISVVVPLIAGPLGALSRGLIADAPSHDDS